MKHIVKRQDKNTSSLLKCFLFINSYHCNNESKLSCISYADGSKMSNFVKYKIINYFTKWLNDNNLLSSETTITF